MTAPALPARSPEPALRRAALLLGVLPTVAAILLITLGPRWLVVDGLAAVLDVLDRVAARTGWAVDPDGVQVLANRAMFVPLGASLGLAVRPRAWPLVLLAGAALSVGVELAQTRIPGRVPDLGDVVANTTGDLIGLALAVLVVGVVRLVVLARSPKRSRARRLGRTAVVLVLVAAAALGTTAVVRGLAGGGGPGAVGAAAPTASPTGSTGVLTRADGYLADGRGVSPFADDEPTVARLRPALRHAVQAAARAAEAQGVDVVVTTGWRSAAYQQRLLDDAVVEYGSRAEALRWVSTPETSKHVRGEAVDIGHTDADDWFLRHGAAYGLCRTYANEMWHFELATTPGGTCPAQREDAGAR